MRDVNIRRILVPTDLSEQSRVALRYARVFAERFSATLTLFYADPIVQPVTPQRLEELDDEIRAYAAGALEGMPYEVAAAGGHSAPQIIREAHEVIADLIVMATHGLRGWRNAVLGSVTEGVLRGGDCPVLSVSRLDERAHVASGFAKIICPVNFTGVAREAVEFAGQLAEAFGVELIVVNVAEVEDVMHAAAAETDIRTWLGPEMQKRFTYREIVLHGGAAERALDFAENIGADLMVIGAQHKLFHSIGTTTEKIVRFARLPVLTIPRRVEAARAEKAVGELALKA
jgi:nucleotide-binding universal stress UspA family protein